MIDAGILPGELHREFRIPGCQARPELTADRRAHSVDIIIVEDPRPRRTDSKCQIPHRDGIFIAMEIHMLFPDFRKNLPIHFRLFHPIQRRHIHCLQLQIIVRHGSRRDRIVVSQIVFKRDSFKGPAEGSSDIFPHPASQNLFPIFLDPAHNRHSYVWIKFCYIIHQKKKK